MIVSVVIVSYTTGGVIFSRFYGHELRSEQQQAKWLKKLRDATATDWVLLKEDHPEQVATVGEVQIVYKLMGDAVLMLAGVEEHDALLLLELARSMDGSIRGACKIPENRQQQTTVSAERRILQHYANLCLIVDEQIDDGDIDHLDPKVILKLIRMKPTR
ncbi:Coatomer subunit zeta [Gracilaria domingensis]|nr:Coatomer subunit zeta [Gracilaria domingensis]